jgi:hypothetical protein
MKIILRSLLAAVVAVSLVMPSLASADRRGDGYRDHGGRHGYSYGHGYKYRDRHHDRRYYPGRHGTRYYYHDHGDNDLLLGLALGGLLGYAIPRYPNYNYYDRY